MGKKTKIRSSLMIFFLISIFVFTVTACSKDEKAEEITKEPIKIGVVGVHTGDLASYGLPTVKAAEIIAEKINKLGGINGRLIELVVEDEGCKPELATNAATKVIGEGVSVVLGHICSGATKAAMGIYKESKIISMSPSATNPALTQSGDYPNFYRTIASDDAQAKLEVDFALNVLKLKNIAVIHDKGDYGKGLAEFAKSILESDSRANVALFEGITPGAVDYSAIVNKIKQSGADAVIYGGYHPEAAKIVTQMRKKKMNIPFISDDGVKDDTFIKVAKEYAEGVYATGPKDTSTNPLNKLATKEHQDKYGEDPGAFFINAYAAMLALTNAIAKSNSTEYEKIENILKTEYVATPLGIIRFDERGDATGIGFSMYQVQNGVYVELTK